MFGVNFGSFESTPEPLLQWLNASYPDLTQYQRAALASRMRDYYTGLVVERGRLLANGADVTRDAQAFVQLLLPELPATAPFYVRIAQFATNPTFFLVIAIFFYLAITYVIHYGNARSRLQMMQRTVRKIPESEVKQTPSERLGEIIDRRRKNKGYSRERVEESAVSTPDAPVLPPPPKKPSPVPGPKRSATEAPTAPAHVGAVARCAACRALVAQAYSDSKSRNTLDTRLKQIAAVNRNSTHDQIFKIASHDVAQHLLKKVTAGEVPREGSLPVSNALAPPAGTSANGASLPAESALNVDKAGAALQHLDKVITGTKPVPGRMTQPRAASKSAAIHREGASAGFGFGSNPGQYFVPATLSFENKDTTVTAFRLANTIVLPVTHITIPWADSSDTVPSPLTATVVFMYNKVSYEVSSAKNEKLWAFSYSSGHATETCVFFTIPRGLELPALTMTAHVFNHSVGEQFPLTLYAFYKGVPTVGQFNCTIGPTNDPLVRGSSGAGNCGGLYFYTPPNSTNMTPYLVHVFDASGEFTPQIPWQVFLAAFRTYVPSGNCGALSKAGL